MELRLLGPVEAVRDGDPIQLGGRQRRTLLAILAVHAGQTVSTDRLIDEIWGDSPPEAARKTVQAHIAHLRKTLNTEREVLASADGGYFLRLEPDDIDVHAFQRFCDAGRRVRDADPLRAVRNLDEALSLFRGAPLAGLADDAPSLRIEADRLQELRMAAMEERLEAKVLAGDLASAIAEAERMLAESPLRERLWGLLMLGLYRSRRQGEALQAYSRARQILGEELGIEPSAELQRLEQRILEQDSGLDGVVTGIPSQPLAATEVIRNPYKGLRAFDEADASDFFGRDGLVRRLLEAVEGRAGPRLLVLAGPSGSGKSSVVRAGLIPELRDRGHRVAVMLPGPDPPSALARALEESSESASPDAVAGAPFDGVLVIDQFEELFTMVEDEGQLDLFLDLVSSAPWPRTVVTVRGDFLDRLLSHPGLGPLLEEALVLVTPLQEHEISATVVKPAQRVGIQVSSDLVREIVHDVRGRPSSLPLLQFALTEAFERRTGDEITVADYQRGGGLAGALARRADELYENLDQAHREAVRQLLLQLVAVTEESEAVRRRVDRDSLLTLIGDESAIARVMERLGALRLLTFDQDSDTGRATVEVAHEALIAEWPRLASWIGEAFHDLEMRRRLRGATSEWEKSGEDPGFLLTGSRLAEMEAWREVSRIEVPENDRRFLSEGRSAEVVAASQQASHRRWLLTGVGSALVVAIVLGSFALTQRRAAADQARVVRASDLAAAANLNLDIDPELSLLLAMEAVETTRIVDGSVLDVATEALHRAVLHGRIVSRLPHAGEGIAHVAPDGESFVTSSEDPTVANVWDLEPLALRVALVGHADPVIDAIYDAESSRIATTSFDGTARVWDAVSGEQLALFAVPRAPPLVPAFSRDGSKLAATSLSGTTWVWDIGSGDVIWELEPPPGTSETVNLEFNPDDSLLAVAPNTEVWVEDFGAQIWDMRSGDLVTILTGHEWEVKDVGFTPDGEHLLTGSWDATVRFWEVGSWDHVRTFFGHEASVWDFQISADGATVASSGNTEVIVWDLVTLEVLDNLSGHVGIIDGIDITPDGELLVTSSFTDGTTRLWDLTRSSTHELIGFSGPEGEFGSVAFSPDGDRLAAKWELGITAVWGLPDGEPVADGSAAIQFDPDGVALHPSGELRLVYVDDGVDGLVHAVAGDTGELIAILDEHRDPVWAMAFSPNGDHFATASLDTTAILWDTETLQPIRRLEAHAGQVFDVEFDPIRPQMATASDDGTIKIWDIETGAARLTLEGAPFTAIEYSPDGRYLAAASVHGYVTVFILSPDELLNEARGRLTRWWTESECAQYLQDETCPPRPEGPEAVEASEG